MRIFLSKGGLDGHDVGIMVIIPFERDAGIEVIYSGIYPSSEEIVAAAWQEDVDMIGISLLSGSHNEIFFRVLDLLKEIGLNDRTVFGGGIIYPKDELFLKNLGVRKIFPPHTKSSEIIQFIEGEKKNLRKREPAKELLDKVLKEKNPLAAAKLITLAEDKDKEALALLGEVSLNSCTWVIGITGPMGVGKSSLLNEIVKQFREKGKTVAVLCSDPSSSISGGAFLGDRLRLLDHYTDPGVFIRSFATRGFSGGIAEAVPSAIKIMELLGKDIILVETTGAGQEEAGVRKYVDTLVLVLGPDSGDRIQLLKSGVIELADIIVLGKADKPEADKMFYLLQDVYASSGKLLFKTSTLKMEGFKELVEGIYSVKKSKTKEPQ